MEVMKMDRAIEKAHGRIEEVTRDSDLMHYYTLRQMALSDWTTGHPAGFQGSPDPFSYLRVCSGVRLPALAGAASSLVADPRPRLFGNRQLTTDN